MKKIGKEHRRQALIHLETLTTELSKTEMAVSDVKDRIGKHVDTMIKSGFIPYCYKCDSTNGIVTKSGTFLCFHCSAQLYSPKWKVKDNK